MSRGNVNRGGAEKRTGFFGDSHLRLVEVVGVNFKSNAVSSPFRGRNRRRTCSHEWIEHRITNKAEHPDKPFGKFKRIRCRVIFC